MENNAQLLKGVLEYCVLKLIAQEPTYGYEIVMHLKQVGFFVGILCMGWNCFEMRGKFCIRSAEPDGAAPLLRGLRSSEVPAKRS